MWCLGLGVWGLGFGIWGFGFGVWGLGLRVRDPGFRVQDSAPSVTHALFQHFLEILFKGWCLGFPLESPRIGSVPRTNHHTVVRLFSPYE